MRLVDDACPEPPLDTIDLLATARDHLGLQLRTHFPLSAAERLPERLSRLIRRFERVVAQGTEPIGNEFRTGLLQAIPALRSFALSLAKNPSRADDLVQETLLKAWANHHRFEPGTRLTAWLCTIMRNLFYSEVRRHRREVEDVEGLHAGRIASAAAQEHVADLRKVGARLAGLPAAQQEALLLVGAEGCTYEQAAHRLGCQVGTVKSRVSRARSQLADGMERAPVRSRRSSSD